MKFMCYSIHSHFVLHTQENDECIDLHCKKNVYLIPNWILNESDVWQIVLQTDLKSITLLKATKDRNGDDSCPIVDLHNFYQVFRCCHFGNCHFASFFGLIYIKWRSELTVTSIDCVLTRTQLNFLFLIRLQSIFFWVHRLCSSLRFMSF